MTDLVGILHPGEMGAAVASELVGNGLRVVWASEGRSPDTIRRAAEAGLEDAGDIPALATTAPVVLSLCPPHAAVDVARAVAATGFAGLYLDANAVAPSTAENIADLIRANGGRFVDGDVIGGPPRPGGHTRLYVSGPDAPLVAALFGASDRLDVVNLGDDLTAASTLKMSYAAWTKGSAALLLAVRALARTTGVEDALLAEWERSQPGLADRSEAARSSAPKAWRFAGEMDEIARCFVEADVAGSGFADAAADVFARLASFKAADPQLGEVLEYLTAVLRDA